MKFEEKRDKAAFSIFRELKESTSLDRIKIAAFQTGADWAKQELGWQIGTLFNSIKHGNQEHQDWLKEAIECHFSGRPVPIPEPPTTSETDSNNKESK